MDGVDVILSKIHRDESFISYVFTTFNAMVSSLSKQEKRIKTNYSRISVDLQSERTIVLEDKT